MFIKVKAFNPAKVKRGHQPHISGAGKHKDKRTKRQRTRADVKRSFLIDD